MRRQARTAVAVLALLMTGLLATASQPASAAPTVPAAHVSNVQVDGRQLRFRLDLTSLPPGSGVDLSSIRVNANGQPLNAHATLGSATGTATVPLPDREAILVLDASGSMQGSRLTASKAAALAYARAVPADVKIGLVRFSDRPAVALAPTVNRAALAAAVASVAAVGNTSLYDAVLTALGAFPARTPGAERRLLILSDGADNISHASLAAAARAVAGSGVRVDAVGIAVSGDQLRALRELTNAGSGQVLPASGLDQLSAAFVQAAQTFSREVAVTADLPAALAGKKVAVTANVTVAGHELGAVTTVQLPAVTVPNASSGGSAPAAARPNLTSTPPVLLLTLSFFGLLGIALVLMWKPRPKPAHETRLDQLDNYSWSPPPVALAGLPGDGSEGAVAAAALSVADRLLRSGNARSRIVTDLERAGMRMRPQEWLLLRISAVIVAIALFTVLIGSLVVGALLGALLGWLGTYVVVRFKAARRCSAFADQLPDVLQLIASSLRSGFSLAQALDGVVREGSQPAASEFGRALAEARLGVEVEDALDGVAERMKCRDLAWVVMAVRISRDVGGNLAEVLLTTVHTIRERAQLKRQIRALSAEGRLSAYVLIALPIFVAGWFVLVRPEYLRPLYTQPLGIAMLSFAVFGVLVGSWWMSRVVKVEV
jgi:tight adherence protein B